MTVSNINQLVLDLFQANPKMSNAAIAALVLEKVPGAKTTAASVASIKSRSKTVVKAIFELSHDKGDKVKAWMSGTFDGVYQGKDDKGRHLVFINDPACWMGVFPFTKFLNGAYCTDRFPTPATVK
jgi:hypothetical protein